MDRRLLLTAGIRADRTSNNGDTGKYFLYPKAAISYRLIKPFGDVDEIKLRGAFGETGNQPLFGQKFSPDSSGTIGGNYAAFPGSTAGDVLLQPERQTEFEGGFDALFASGRAELNFTVYQRMITDLILTQTLAPSMGQEFRTFSSDGRLRNQGIEAAFNVSPVVNRNIELAAPDHVLPQPQPDPLAGRRAPLRDRRLRHLAGRVLHRARQVGDPDRGHRGRRGRRRARLPDVVLQRPHLPARSASASCSTGSRAATTST